MDPNPNKFPILSFVLSRVNSTFARAPDLEQPDADADHRRRAADEDRRRDAALLAQMPGLNEPALVAAMAEAVSQVSQTRAILSALGDRPDHEAVDRARAGFAEADAALARQLEELSLSPPLPAGAGAAEWRARQEELERGYRRRAEADKAAYKAVMQLEQMHDAYEKVLGEAEERLLRIYRAAGSGGGAGLGEGKASVGKGKEVMNEEVASILRDGESGKLIERVDLSGQQLTLLPEAFGRIRGLVSLNLSSNQLEVIRVFFKKKNFISSFVWFVLSIQFSKSFEPAF